MPQINEWTTSPSEWIMHPTHPPPYAKTRLPNTTTIKSKSSPIGSTLANTYTFFHHHQEYNTDLVPNVVITFLFVKSILSENTVFLTFHRYSYSPYRIQILFLPGWNSQNILHKRTPLVPRWLLRPPVHVNWYWQIGQSQRTHDAKITSLWHQNDVALSS